MGVKFRIGGKGGGPIPAWARIANARLEIGSKALAGRLHWEGITSPQVALKYLDNVERCYATDPVRFAHFQPYITALVAAKLTT